MIDLEPRYIELVRRILARYVPKLEVRVFGSRINGTSRAYSDLDLVIVGMDALDWQRLNSLKEAFAESDLPFMVDVLDWNQISDEFRKLIDRNYEVIQKAGDNV